ncbi:MAG TPA: leucyl aminopeptidase, partial [Thermoleophilaceae bacterium]
MSPIGVSARRGAAGDTDADTRIVGLFEGESLDEPELQELIDSGEAKGGFKKLAMTHVDGKRVVVVGLGKRADFDAERARVAAAVAAGRASELGGHSLSWAAPTPEVAGALVEGTLLKLYKFDQFKSKKNGDDEDDSGDGVTSLEVSSADADLVDSLSEATVRSDATNRTRDLQNLPSNVATPEFLSNRAREIADAHGSLQFEVFGRDQIVEMGMGSFAAVAQGTYAEPQLIVLRYSPSDAKGAHLGLVGKAVTFDSGGISIKPAGKMHEMKFDMSGGAAVIEAMGAIAELAVPARVTAVVAATENMPSGRSMKPGDIVTAMNGKTIEINNTDAEGRLILADALCYAVEQGAEKLVDIATLTGAIVVALGSTYSGLFANDDDWYGQVAAAGDTAGEPGWRMPLHDEYLDLTKGTYADLQNSSEQRKASSAYAAEFLRQFVDGRPWVHMDIAGTAWSTGNAWAGNGATGFGTRTFIELAETV